MQQTDGSKLLLTFLAIVQYGQVVFEKITTLLLLIASLTNLDAIVTFVGSVRAILSIFPIKFKNMTF